ncbi:GSCOCT00014160001.2-RA-CDS, partial [Cotesia congregata]
MAVITRYLVLDFLVLICGLIVLSYLYMTRKFKYWKKHGVTEITPTPFVGNFGDCLMTKKSSGQWLRDIHEWSSGLPYMGFYIFDRPCLLIRDPELVKNILVKDFNTFPDRFVSASPHDRIGDANLFLIKNPAWKVVRTKLTPLYTSGKLKRMFELMVDVGEDLMTHMKSLKLEGQGQNVEVKDLSAKFTTDMIATTAFGVRANCLNDPNAAFREAGRRVFATSLYRNFELTSLFFAPQLAKPLGLKFIPSNASKFLRDTLWGVILERERSNYKRGDLIDLLVELRKANAESSTRDIFDFDGDNLVAQAVVFYTGGFETSSSALSFTLYEIAIQPEIQTRLRQEILDGLEQSDGKVTYDLVQLFYYPYLDMVVAETLRKYPPLPFLDRLTKENYKLPNSDLVVEKGTPVFISMTGLHYDPEYFPDPNKYDPERFSEANKKSRKQGVYIPFGDGPHICIGLRIGLLQTKLGLIKLLPKYEFSPSKETMIPMRLSPKATITTADGGVFLNVKEIAY